MAELPKPVRAYIGLWARAISEARDLPRRAAELPVLVASTTARATLRAGQQYADLINRGDDVLSHLHGAPDEPPAWATFDDDPADDPGSRTVAIQAAPARAAREAQTAQAARTAQAAQAARTDKTVIAPRDRKLSAFDTVGLEEGFEEGFEEGPDAR